MEDRMSKYYSRVNDLISTVGLITGIVAIIENNIPAAIVGAGTILAGYLGQNLAYQRGFANEQLELMQRNCRPSELEEKNS